MGNSAFRVENNNQRWFTIFGLLSMDNILPFLNDMRLGFIDINTIRPYARKYVEFYEKKWRDDILQSTFDNIANATSNSISRALYDWGNNQCPLDGSELGDEFLWRILLQRLAGVGKMISDPQLPFTKEKTDLIIAIVTSNLGLAQDNHYLWQKIDKVRSKQGSKWDIKIYGMYEEGTDLFDIVIEVINYHDFKDAWFQIKELLTDSELDLLLHWGKELGRYMNIPSQLIRLPM